LERRKAEATLDRKRAEARDYRAKGETLQAELDALNKKSDALLEKLAELQGVPYDRSVLAAQRTGTWVIHHTVTDARNLPYCPPEVQQAEVTGPNRGRYLEPRSRTLMDKIQTLTLSAQAIEHEFELEEQSAREALLQPPETCLNTFGTLVVKNPDDPLQQPAPKVEKRHDVLGLGYCLKRD
jgi:hypothetical protein